MHTDAPWGSCSDAIDRACSVAPSCTQRAVCSDVLEATAEDREDAAKYPEDEVAQRKRVGATEPVGEDGYTTLERTCNPTMHHAPRGPVI